MQPVGVPGAAEQAKNHVVGVDEGGDVSGQDHEAEQGGIAPGANPDDVHSSPPARPNLLPSLQLPARHEQGSVEGIGILGLWNVTEPRQYGEPRLRQQRLRVAGYL